MILDVRNANSFRKFALIILCGLATSGCASINPLIRNINVISVTQEKTLSQQVSTQIAGSMKVVDTEASFKNLHDMGTRLVAALPQRDFDYQFHIVQDSTPNAFTIPGGVIYVNTGLINFVDDEDELAGVVAHELGHAYLRHPAKSLTRQYGASFLQTLVLGNQPTTMRKIALQLAAGGVLQKYGRDDEYEADDMAYYLTSRAGYKTDGLVRFFKKLVKLEKGNKMPAFLSTHPSTPDRIARLEAREKNITVAGSNQKG